MPSAELCSKGNLKMSEASLNISNDVVEGLVSEIKENLRLSGPTSMKALPCSHLSRKQSRASPYRVPGKYFDPCDKHKKQSKELTEQDPYELLQALLRSESLINEAVRRVQMGLKTEKLFYYESSDEDCSRSPLKEN